MAGGKIALIIILLLLVVSALIFLVLLVLYWVKLNNCLSAPTTNCQQPFCADGSNPLRNAEEAVGA